MCLLLFCDGQCPLPGRALRAPTYSIGSAQLNDRLYEQKDGCGRVSVFLCHCEEPKATWQSPAQQGDSIYTN